MSEERFFAKRRRMTAQAAALEYEEEVRSPAGKPLLGQEEVERQRGHVVGEGLQPGVLLQVEELEVGAAVLAGLGLGRARSPSRAR